MWDKKRGILRVVYGELSIVEKKSETVLPSPETISGVRHVLSYGVHPGAEDPPGDRCYDGRTDNY